MAPDTGAGRAEESVAQFPRAIQRERRLLIAPTGQDEVVSPTGLHGDDEGRGQETTSHHHPAGG